MLTFKFAILWVRRHTEYYISIVGIAFGRV